MSSATKASKKARKTKKVFGPNDDDPGLKRSDQAITPPPNKKLIEALAEVAKTQHVPTPIVVRVDDHGHVVSGWDDYEAWKSLDPKERVPLQVDRFPKDVQPLADFLINNLARAHYSTSQRACIGAQHVRFFAGDAYRRKLNNLLKGDKKPEAAALQHRAEKGSSVSKVAKILGVSERLVYDALKLRKLDQAVFEKVWHGPRDDQESSLLTISRALKKLKESKFNEPAWQRQQARLRSLPSTIEKLVKALSKQPEQTEETSKLLDEIENAIKSARMKLRKGKKAA